MLNCTIARIVDMNMPHIYAFVLGIFIVLFIGCQDPTSFDTNVDKKFYDFESHKKATGKVVVESDSIFLPSDITLADSMLLMRDAEGPPFVHAYNLGSGELYSFGEEGRGPNEFTGVWEIDNVHNTDYFRIFDLSSRKVHICDVDSIKDKSQDVCSLEAEILSEGVPLRVNMTIKDKIFASGIYDKRIATYDSTGEIENVFGRIPKNTNIKGKLPISKISKAYESNIDVSTSNKKVVAASMFSDRIDIYDFGEGDPFTIRGPDMFLPTFSLLESGRLMHTDGTRTSYIDVSSKGKFVYAAYKGYVDDKNKNNDEIHVFKISGEPTEKIELDFKINSIEVGNSANFLYCTSNDPRPRVIRISI